VSYFPAPFSTFTDVSSATGGPIGLSTNESGKLLIVDDAVTVPTGLPVGFQCAVFNDSGSAVDLTTTGLTVKASGAADNIVAAGRVVIQVIATDTILLTGDFGAFDPSTLPGYTMHIDPSDTGTITESAGDVSQIDDISGNGHHLVQGTASLQPQTGVDTINGLNAISGDGTADFMQTAAGIFAGGTVSECTFFQVVKNAADLNAVSADVSPNGSGYSDAPQCLMTQIAYNPTGGSENRLYINQFSDSLTVTARYAHGWAGSEIHVMAYRVSVANNYQQIWEDGVLADEANGPDTVTACNVIGGLSWLGFPGTASDTRRSDNALGELIVYEASLTDGQIGQVTDYLTTKWGPVS